MNFSPPPPPHASPCHKRVSFVVVTFTTCPHNTMLRQHPSAFHSQHICPPPHIHTSLRAATIPSRNLLEHRYIIEWHESSCDNDYRMELSCDNDYRMKSSLRKTIPKPTQELLLPIEPQTFDLESSALSIWPHIPQTYVDKHFNKPNSPLSRG